MNTPPPGVWILGAFVLTAWLTRLVLRYARANSLLDVPNVRSSHTVATPRGGGVAILLTMIAGILLAAWRGWLPWPHAYALAGGGALVGAIGFADDHRPLARRWRLLGHFAAAGWVLGWLGGLPDLPVFGYALEFGWLGYAVGTLYIVWLVNLTNFMDGIDGIAATEGMLVAGGGAGIVALALPGNTAWLMPSLLAAASAGFLVWNWPPAKIFMGDSGSGFLGLALATLSIQTASAAPHLFWSWVILLGVFVVDATVTLVCRALRGDPVYEPHRTHAYQHAAAQYAAHAPVTLAVGAIDLGWLLPLALLVAVQKLDGVTAAVVAYAPLAAAALWLGAGRPARVQ